MPICRPIIKFTLEYGKVEYENIRLTIFREGYERTFSINERQVVGLMRNIKRWRVVGYRITPTTYTLENPNYVYRD